MKALLVSLTFFVSIGLLAQTDPLGPNLVTLPVSNITSTSATSGGDILSDGGNFIFSRGVVWDEMLNPTLDTNAGMMQSGQGIGQYDITMTGLIPNTQYYVRAFAQDFTGEWYGGNVSFQTAAASIGELNDVWVSIGPNPTVGRVSLRWESKDELESIELFDIYGRTVRKDEVIGMRELNWDLGHLAAGNYLVHWKSDQHQGVLRLIKK